MNNAIANFYERRAATGRQLFMETFDRTERQNIMVSIRIIQQDTGAKRAGVVIDAFEITVFGDSEYVTVNHAGQYVCTLTLEDFK